MRTTELASGVTLDGWPPNLWARNSAPREVTGQAVIDVRWAVASDGAPIRTAPVPPRA
jgi:hypothetical protein